MYNYFGMYQFSDIRCIVHNKGTTVAHTSDNNYIIGASLYCNSSWCYTCTCTYYTYGWGVCVVLE